MYYSTIKHDRHLRTRGKCRKHEPQASVFYFSGVFSNDWITSPRARVSLLAAHENFREKRRYLAGVQAIKSRFFLVT